MAAEGILASAAASLGVGIQTVLRVDERELASELVGGGPSDGGPDPFDDVLPLKALLPDRWRPLAEGLQALGAPDPIV
jgi:hypothetical protein